MADPDRATQPFLAYSAFGFDKTSSRETEWNINRIRSGIVRSHHGQRNSLERKMERKSYQVAWQKCSIQGEEIDIRRSVFGEEEKHEEDGILVIIECRQKILLGTVKTNALTRI